MSAVSPQTTSPDAEPPSESPRTETPSTSVFDVLLAPFSSVKTGIVLMVLIFIYASIGSAGLPVSIYILEPASWVPVREFMEMSEFRWFHWWPFDVLIALFCLNITVVTIRKIPFNILTFGVWMVHTGLVMLAIGSVIYFSMKREGDAPVARAHVVLTVPGEEPVRLMAEPGKTVVIGNDANAWQFQVAAIDPFWEMLSGDDAGKRAYKVSLFVDHNEQRFIRELLLGYPQYTEDVVKAPDADIEAGKPPFVRAKKAFGQAIVNNDLKAELVPAPTDHFFLMESRSIYLRERGSDTWHQRRISGMPLFRDRITDGDRVLVPPTDNNEDRPVLSAPLAVKVPPSGEDDPLPDVDLYVTDYVKHGFIRERRTPNGDRFNPAIFFRLVAEDRERDVVLAPFDPMAAVSNDSFFSAIYAPDEATVDAVAAFTASQTPFVIATDLTTGTQVILSAVDTVLTNKELGTDLEWTAIPGSDYRVRVQLYDSRMQPSDRESGIASVEVRRNDDAYTRLAFADARSTVDVSVTIDESGKTGQAFRDFDRDLSIRVVNNPMTSHFAIGPGPEQVRLIFDPAKNIPNPVFPITPNAPVILGSGITLNVLGIMQNSVMERRPMVTLLSQRDPNVGMHASHVRIAATSKGAPAPKPGAEEVDWTGWLSYHHFVFDTKNDAFVRFKYEPLLMTLPDGREFEILWSRQREPLPNAVRLDDFRIDSRIGGFTGETSSIKDWNSIVRFEEDGKWSDQVRVHVNHPKPSGEYWFFQSQWDPPRPASEDFPASNGLNYTVLGVGNRHGVVLQLVGSAVSVFGMIWAFYVKPWIKRRRQRLVLASIDATSPATEEEVSA